MRLKFLPLALIGLAALTLAAPINVVFPYNAQIQYLAYKTVSLTVQLGPGGTYTISPPAVTPGSGFAYAGMVIQLQGVYPSIQVAANGFYSKSYNSEGFLQAVYVGPDANKVMLINTANANIQVQMTVTYQFVSDQYVQLTNSTVLTIALPNGKLPQGFGESATVRIDPNAPYVISSVELPDGQPASAYRVEPKVVELTQPGTYKVVISSGPSLPPALLVKSLQQQTATVGPNSQLTVSGAQIGVPQGWQLLGYIVFAYTGNVNLVGQQSGGQISISGGLVDIVNNNTLSFVIRSISYLIPPLWQAQLTYTIAIVYGTSFTVTSTMNSPVNVIYIPVVYKPAQVTWLPDRALVNVTQSDMADGVWTAVVLQLPALAKIVSIKTPGNAVITNATDVQLVWGGGVRMASISPDGHEAYIVVQEGNTAETGVYTFMINWSPLTISVVNKFGGPVGDISASAGQYNAAVSNGVVQVYVYKPEPVRVQIAYKGVPAADVLVQSLDGSQHVVQLGIYNVKVVVVGALNQPIPNAQVAVTGFPASGTTDSSGAVLFQGVLEGNYALSVNVGNRVHVTSNLTVAGPSQTVTVVVKTPIVAIINGVPITVTDTAAAAGGVSAAGLALALRRMLRKAEEGEVAEVEQI
ncbi:MAG: carboxypeptidase-like regulatory domain-containing protein [Thermoproteus sp.]